MKSISLIIYILIISALWLTLFSCTGTQDKRLVISLNGKWEVAESADSLMPVGFSSSVPVPGLIDLAEPSFENCAYTYADPGRENTGDPNFKRKYFWYKKSVSLNRDRTDFAFLKVHKAKFGHTVYVNGQYIDSYNYCFTPGIFEISKYLNFKDENEIVVRIGASPEALPDSIPFGFEIEKSKYYSGIYDNVELFLGNYPYIENIQVVPDIEKQKISAILYLENGEKERSTAIRYRVKEKISKKIIVSAEQMVQLGNAAIEVKKIEIEIPDMKLWSPEQPFLYELQVETAGDSKSVTFGMREFRFDTKSRLVLLNHKPFYLRGTNIAIHRFFEDTIRHELPWDRNWIDKMHDEFKDMYWNSYRFHIGFAPEVWYEVADEKGFLVQDEYAIWALFLKDSSMYSTMQQHRHKASVLAREYRAWMRERWNHPSVVVWDAQNETWWDETGKAIKMVRDLDVSNRPWDNGFSPPQSTTDMIESHPYLFAHDQALTFNVNREWPEEGLLKHDLGKHPEPFNDPNLYEPPGINEKYNNPVIINEYGWIWLYRDGTPASVAENIWKFYPEYSTPETRWEWRGRVIAAKTEYWRSRRDIAGVQHFCMLTCDRPWEPRSQVSDDWYDVKNLIMQPQFKKYVKPAFSPVGLFIDWFYRKVGPGETIEVPVILFNDLSDKWEGTLKLKLLAGGSVVYEENRKNIVVNPFQKTKNVFTITVPDQKGEYEIVTEIYVNNEHIFSSRLFVIQ